MKSELPILRARIAELEAELRADSIRMVGRLTQFAWSLMILTVVFAVAVILAGAIRASAHKCPPLSATQPRLENP